MYINRSSVIQMLLDARIVVPFMCSNTCIQGINSMATVFVLMQLNWIGTSI